MALDILYVYLVRTGLIKLIGFYINLVFIDWIREPIISSSFTHHPALIYPLKALTKLYFIVFLWIKAAFGSNN